MKCPHCAKKRNASGRPGSRPGRTGRKRKNLDPVTTAAYLELGDRLGIGGKKKGKGSTRSRSSRAIPSPLENPRQVVIIRVKGNRNPVKMSMAEAKRLGFIQEAPKVVPIRKGRSSSRKSRKSRVTRGLVRAYKVGRAAGRAIKKTRRAAAGVKRGFTHGLFNPSAEKLFEEFRGRPVRDWEAIKVSKIVPRSTVAQAGRLVSMTVRPRGGHHNHKLRFKRDAQLVRTGRHTLAIGNVRFKQPGIRKNPGELLHGADVVELEYVADKPHLKAPTKTLFFHKHGEETGVLPPFLVDREGYGLIEGGRMTVDRRGIVD